MPSTVYKIQEMVYLAFISDETCSNVLFLVSGTNEKMNSTDMAQIMLKDINVQETPRPSKNRMEINLKYAWVKVQNFQNLELLKIKSLNLQYAYKYQQFQV